MNNAKLKANRINNFRLWNRVHRRGAADRGGDAEVNRYPQFSLRVASAVCGSSTVELGAGLTLLAYRAFFLKCAGSQRDTVHFLESAATWLTAINEFIPTTVEAAGVTGLTTCFTKVQVIRANICSCRINCRICRRWHLHTKHRHQTNNKERKQLKTELFLHTDWSPLK